MSAEKDDDGVWHIGVTDYQVGFGRFKMDLEQNDFDVIDGPYGDSIIFSADEHNSNHIVLKEGIYHIDAQVDVNVADVAIPVLGFYPVSVSANIAPWATVTRDVDNSYEHTDTIELSFDAYVKNESELLLDVLNIPGNSTRFIKNLNITEQIGVDAILQGGGSNYIAGDAIGIDASTNAINVKPGGGLKIDRNNNTLTINCGNGLKINEESLEATLELDEVTEEIVQEVEKMAEDLETKVTVNFDYANIEDSYDFTTYGATAGSGVLLGNLFAVPINTAIFAEDDNDSDFVTVIGVYSKQGYTQNYVIFGLYEYDPVTRKTEALCDTGRRKLTQGLNEFTIKHLCTKTTPELKSGCLYYATIYVSDNPGTGLFLAGCRGYNTTFNTVPQLTTDQSNIAGDLTEGGRKPGSWPANLDDVNFDLFGFGWGGSGNYHELPNAPRFFMQIRNVKKTNG